MDVDAQKPSSKKAAPSSKPRAKRAGTAGAAADAAVAAKATKKAKASSSSPPAAPAAGVGSGRAAAQNVKYDFDVGAGSFSRRGDVVEVKAAREAEDEAAAVELLGGAQAAADGRFRLLDLAVFEDGTGELVPLDRVGLAGSRPLFASAVVTRAEGAPRSAGVAVARLGPLSGFGVDGIPSSADSDSSPVALTLTSTASGLTYVVSRASPAYRKLLAHVQEEAELAAETARVLVAALDENKKSANPATATPPSYESVVIRLARARAGKPYGGPRAALEACGAFVLETLEKHAPALVAAGAAFAAELEDKVEAARGAAGRVRGNGISIVDAADAKGKGKAPVAASAAAAAAALDPKGKGKAAVAVTASSVAAAPVSFASKASALPLPERFALREGDFARQIAAKAASAEGLVSLQVATDAAARAADGKAVDGKAFKQVTAAQAERFAARAASAAAGSGDGAYIVLSMSELADEYPAPKPAPERDADAGDEIELLGGELDFFDAGANPDELQSFDLFDFSLFNSDSMMAPLELVPAFSGGEPPVEVFAMGRMAEHDEETAFATPEQVVAAARARAAGNNNNGGGSSAGGSSSAADASPPAPIGMPLLLSQIQEWYVEGAADLDSCQLWVRTELARYRLVSPDPAYAPWHAVVLRAVRWAVRSMHAVGSASRASRVSFEDIVKEVAREPEDSVDFVSRDPRAVERFLVCHGQIVLNQFSALLQQDRTQDARAVAQCAFAQSLRSKMLERRHLKLYAPSKAALKAMQLAARKASAKSGGRAGRAPRALKTNPLKGSAAAKARAAPMTATATNMVRAVWQSYFAAAGVGRGGSGDGEAPVGDASSAVVAAKAIPLKVYAKAGIEEVKAEAGIAKEVEEADPNADDDEEEEKPDAAAAAPAAAASSPADGGADARAAAAKPAAAPRPSLAPEVLGSPLPGPIDAAPLELSGSGPVSFYSRALIGEKGSSRTEVALGDVVSLAVGVELASLGDHDDVARYLAVARQRSRDAELPETPLMGIVQAIFVESAAAGKGKKAAPKVQLRVVVHGCDTVLGDAASDAELFVTPRFAAFPLADAAEKLDAQRRQRRWDPKDTSLHAAEALEDERLREGNNEKLAAGKPLSYIYRTAYLPLKGMFQILPADLGLGEPVANEPAPEKGLARGKAAVKAKGAAAAPQSATFKKDGVEYRVGDAVYLPPDAFDSEEQVEEPAAAAKKAKGKDKKSASPASDDEEEEEEEAPAVDANGKLLPGSRSRFHKGGANLGLRAFAVGVIRAIPDSTGANAKSAPITVTRCARPEDVSERVAYEAGWWDIFATSEVVSVDAAAIVRKCHVVAKSTAPAGSPLVSDAAPAAIEGVFTCVGTADLERKTVDRTKVPEDLRAADEVLAELKKENLALASSAASADAKAAEARAAAADKTSKAQGDGISLATMDIFAGCGGLSEGLHQYRAAHAKWAIEYEHPAAVRFLALFAGAGVFAEFFSPAKNLDPERSSPCVVSLSLSSPPRPPRKKPAGSLPPQQPGRRDVRGQLQRRPRRGDGEARRLGPVPPLRRLRRRGRRVEGVRVLRGERAQLQRPLVQAPGPGRGRVPLRRAPLPGLLGDEPLQQGELVARAELDGDVLPVVRRLLPPALLPARERAQLRLAQQVVHVQADPAVAARDGLLGALRRAQRRQLWRLAVAQAHVHLGGRTRGAAPRVALGPPRVQVAAADDQPPRRRAVHRGAADEPRGRAPEDGDRRGRDRRPPRDRQRPRRRREAGEAGVPRRGAAVRLPAHDPLGPARSGLVRLRRRPAAAVRPHLQDDERPQPRALPLHPQGRPGRRLACPEEDRRRRPQAAGRQAKVQVDRLLDGGAQPPRRRRQGRQAHRRPDPVVPAQHRGAPQRLARALRPARPARPLPDVDDRPAADGQGRAGLPPDAGPHRVRPRVRARAGVPGRLQAVGQRAPEAQAGRERRSGAAVGGARQAAARGARGDGGGEEPYAVETFFEPSLFSLSFYLGFGEEERGTDGDSPCEGSAFR